MDPRDIFKPLERLNEKYMPEGDENRGTRIRNFFIVALGAVIVAAIVRNFL